MSLTGKDIAEIARLLDASHFTSLDLTQGEFRLRIRRDGGGGSWVRDDDGEDDNQERVPAQAGTSRHTDTEPVTEKGPRLRGDSPIGDGEVEILAPLIGNFYSSPRPGEPPFVQIGDRVSQDTAVAIIEVMKLMNSVPAGVAGVVTAVLVENGSAVAEGQPLYRVKVG